MKESYLEKNNDYFSNVREDIISFIGDKKNLTILEIGAGSGATLLELKKLGVANKIYGYDIMDVVMDKSNFEEFHVGNIENEKLPFDENYFDIVIIADVLEHLLDPEASLKKIIPLLKNKGEIYISLPNIRYFSALYNIFFKGNFKYEEQGVLDKTHLRFFCKKNMKELVLKMEDVELIKTVSHLKHIKIKKSLLNKLTFTIFEEFLSMQYFLKLQKK